MGIPKTVKAAIGTAAVVAGSVTGQPSAASQQANWQKVQQQRRQTASLTEATRAKNAPTTSGRR